MEPASQDFVFQLAAFLSDRIGSVETRQNWGLGLLMMLEAQFVAAAIAAMVIYRRNGNGSKDH